MQFFEVKLERGDGLLTSGMLQRVLIDTGVAVAIAADPTAHAQKWRKRLGGRSEGRALGLGLEPFGHIGIQGWNLAQKGLPVERERILDFVGYLQAGITQQARLPEGRDATQEGTLQALFFVCRK